MPKNKKRGKNAKNKKGASEQKRAIEFKEAMQDYVVMTKMLGDRRILVKLADGSEKMAIIPGRFRKRCWMKVGDVLLASWREFEDTKLDIIHKYNSDEVRHLVNYEEIPSFFLDVGSGATEIVHKDLGITFTNDDREFSFDEI